MHVQRRSRGISRRSTAACDRARAITSPDERRRTTHFAAPPRNATRGRRYRHVRHDGRRRTTALRRHRTATTRVGDHRAVRRSRDRARRSERRRHPRATWHRDAPHPAVVPIRRNGSTTSCPVGSNASRGARSRSALLREGACLLWSCRADHGDLDHVRAASRRAW